MKYVIVLLSLVLTSCGSIALKKVKPETRRIKLTKNDIEKFNGKYDVTTVDSLWRTLDYSLFAKSPYPHNEPPDGDDFIILEVQDEKSIKVTAIHNGEILRSKILKGKLKNNYFVFKTQYRMPIFTFIFNGISFQKTRIGILKNGNLTVDSEGGGGAYLVLFPIFVSGNHDHKHEFKRIE